jgi:hypothetical protein
MHLAGAGNGAGLLFHSALDRNFPFFCAIEDAVLSHARCLDASMIKTYFQSEEVCTPYTKDEKPSSGLDQESYNRTDIVRKSPVAVLSCLKRSDPSLYQI